MGMTRGSLAQRMKTRGRLSVGSGWFFDADFRPCFGLGCFWGRARFVGSRALMYYWLIVILGFGPFEYQFLKKKVGLMTLIYEKGLHIIFV